MASPKPFPDPGPGQEGGRGRTAVGSTPAVPLTDLGWAAPQQGGPPLLFGRPLASGKHSAALRNRAFPPPHTVLRLPAEMQLKQLIF